MGDRDVCTHVVTECFGLQADGAISMRHLPVGHECGSGAARTDRVPRLPPQRNAPVRFREEGVVTASEIRVSAARIAGEARGFHRAPGVRVRIVG